MNDTQIKNLSTEWEDMTYKVLALQEPTLNQMQDILAKTYKVLFDLKSESLIPKAAAELIANMDEFFYFLSFIGKNENLKIFYYYSVLSSISVTLKEDFFKNSFELDYPKIIIRIFKNDVEFDFQKDNFVDLLKTSNN